MKVSRSSDHCLTESRDGIGTIDRSGDTSSSRPCAHAAYQFGLASCGAKAFKAAKSMLEEIEVSNPTATSTDFDNLS